MRKGLVASHGVGGGIGFSKILENLAELAIKDEENLNFNNAGHDQNSRRPFETKTVQHKSC